MSPRRAAWLYRWMLRALDLLGRHDPALRRALEAAIKEAEAADPRR